MDSLKNQLLYPSTMGIFILTNILFSLCPISSFGQLSEHFSDGNLSKNPTWQGDVEKFIVTNNYLISNSETTNDIFYISTPSYVLEKTQWNIKLSIDFKTSSANYIDIFLASDSSNPAKATQTYFIRLGGTKDEISLYKKSGNETKLLIDGTDGKTENITLDLIITFNQNIWELKVNYDDGSNPVVEGTFRDNQPIESNYFSILIKQSTPSFFYKHRFHEIYVGPILRDRKPPKIDSTQVINSNTLKLFFNEYIDTTQTLFELNHPKQRPNTIILKDSTATLTYPYEFSNGRHILQIIHLRDLAGNRIDTFAYITIDKAQKPNRGDVIINEIHIDPSPPIHLPEAEYIELFNPSSSDIELEHCILYDDKSSIKLPQLIIPKNTYMVLCDDLDISLFQSIPHTVGIKSLPTLNNTSDQLILKNEKGELIDSLSYTQHFYGDETKMNGGYSLERIHMQSSCPDHKNWIASQHPDGGTPGFVNSVSDKIIDSLPPKIIQITIDNLKIVTLKLDEIAVNEQIAEPNNYRILPDNLYPEYVSVLDNNKEIQLTFASTLPSHYILQLSIAELTDCFGNMDFDQTVEIIPIQEPVTGDILINEILFNPLPKGVDFIELYNISDKYISLNTLQFKVYKNAQLSQKITLETSQAIGPKQYITLTTDSLLLKNDYPLAIQIQELPKIPEMNNTEGIISLYTSADHFMDSIHYHENQHFALLNDYDGVSLERINFGGKGHDPHQWHSASSEVGYATPGNKNSQFISDEEQKLEFNLSSKFVSPDGDGYEDYLALKYHLKALGYILNGYIYNLSGFLMHQPFNNISIGSHGLLKWDGVLNDGSKLPIGNYILQVEAFNSTGEVIRKKIAFGILGTF